jgi:WD40 repeat protein
LAFTPNGQVLASGGLDKIIKLWDLEHGTALRNLPGHLQNITLLRFSADGKILASASSDAIVKLWDVSRP